MSISDGRWTLRYPLSWPAWLATAVADAANARTVSIAAWMREAAIEKLERAEKGRGGSVRLDGIRSREIVPEYEPD